MKKFIYTLAAVVVSVTAAAQDLIVTVDAQEIEAKIIEVGETQIKYKQQSNPDGPTYTMNIANIFYVKYANGVKDTFGVQKDAMVQQTSVVIKPILNVENTPIAQNTTDAMSQYDGLIPYDFKGLYMLTEAETVMSEQEVYDAFSVVDSNLYDRWRSAVKLRRTGTSLLSVGLGCGVLGLVWGIVGPTQDMAGLGIAGWAIFGASQLVLIPGIVLMCVGTGKQASVLRDFKEAAGIHTVSPSIRFGIVEQGVGMSLRF